MKMKKKVSVSYQEIKVGDFIINYYIVKHC